MITAAEARRLAEEAWSSSTVKDALRKIEAEAHQGCVDTKVFLRLESDRRALRELGFSLISTRTDPGTYYVKW